MAGLAGPLSFGGLAALGRSGRQLSAGAFLIPRGKHLGTGDQQGHEVEGYEHHEQGNAGDERQDRWHRYRNGDRS
jgi:hypothetical protein